MIKITRIIETKYMPPFPYTDDINVLEGYLREGNEDERVEAICRIKHVPKNYNLFWEVFLSDESSIVRGNALSAAMTTRPDKIWEILDYLIKTNERVDVWRGSDYNKNDEFIVQVAKRLNDIHKRK